MGYARGTLNTPPAGLPVLCATTASPIPESTCFPSGCPHLAQNFAAPIWMTFRQASELNAHVRKGEKGSLVVYANAITRTEHDDKTGEDVEREIPYMKGYTVFNVEQIEGLPEIYYAKAAPTLDPVARIDHAEKFFASYGGDYQTRRKPRLLCAGTGLRADAALRSLPRCRKLLLNPRP